MPKVSVLLTSFNHGAFLAESIDSVLGQDFEDFELVIIDDDSTDNSWGIISRYVDPRIRAKRNEKNRRDPVTRDIISSLRGEYVAIAHSDDAWAPHKLGKQVAWLDAHPECGACFTRVSLVDDSGLPFENPPHYLTRAFGQENRGRHAWLRYMLLDGCPFCHPSVLMRREIYDEPNMFAAGLHATPDFYRWISVAMRHEIYIYPELLTRFRVHRNEANTSAETADSRRRQLVELWFALRLYQKIDSPGELAEIFPEALAYQQNGEMHTGFALARILLDIGTLRLHRLLGLELLFKLLNDPAQCVALSRLYGYTYRDFYADTAKYDVFGYIAPERFQCSSLYLDTGRGFSDTGRVVLENYITEAGRFFIRFQLPPGQLTPRAVRFDPDEGAFRDYRISSVTIDGLPAAFKAGNAVSESGWDHFFTFDPQYIVEPPTAPFQTVEIAGETRLLPPAVLEQALAVHLPRNGKRTWRRRLREAWGVFRGPMHF